MPLDRPPPLRLDSTLDSQNQGKRKALRRTPHSSRHTAASRSEDSVSQLPHPHPSRPYRACAASLYLHADHSSESTPRRFRDRNTARRIETASSPRQTPYISHDNDSPTLIATRSPERRFYTLTSRQTTESRV
ncbi:hypothetical protein CSAL01_03772 [Colletotrichum salicis]|uniref:Uncharacterized protein n=1 Tax=Colletotrichum salicis TaxID=1209931 RepID=A0A135UZL2_9PEZI|nr:hypothetical protein CSAL01_03772 [Colletotrichum salicis]